MFTTCDEIQSTLLRLLSRQANTEMTDPILASAILDLHDLMLTMDSKPFSSILWINEGAK